MIIYCTMLVKKWVTCRIFWLTSRIVSTPVLYQHANVGLANTFVSTVFVFFVNALVLSVFTKARKWRAFCLIRGFRRTFLSVLLSFFVILSHKFKFHLVFILHNQQIKPADAATPITDTASHCHCGCNWEHCQEIQQKLHHHLPMNHVWNKTTTRCILKKWIDCL